MSTTGRGHVLAARLSPFERRWLIGRVARPHGVDFSTVATFVMRNAGTHGSALVNVAVPLAAAFIGARILAAKEL